MNIVVFGATDLTLSVVDFLYNNSYQIAAIVTCSQVFKISYEPNGVNNVRFVDLNSWAAERNLPVISYHKVDQTINELNNLGIQIDFAIVVGWYHMVPRKLRNLFPMGCGGFHASLLPKLRGGAPLNWAILLGLKETGVSFFELSNGVDNGLLYDQEKFSIEPTDAIGQLVEKSRVAILKILKRTLLAIKLKKIQGYEQQGRPSYCGQRVPEDSHINWNDSADTILLIIKASSQPYVGAYSLVNEEKIIIWDAEVDELDIYGVPGQIMIIDEKIHIVCGSGSLLLKEVENLDMLIKSNHKRISF